MSIMRYVKFPKLKVSLDNINNTLIIDGISKTSCDKAKSQITVSESLVDKDDPEFIFSPYKYMTIEIKGKLLKKLYKKLTEYYDKNNSNHTDDKDDTDNYWREAA